MLAEEQRFAHTLDVGLRRLEEVIRLSQECGPPAGFDRPELPGEEAFKLYDTFGMPLDFMQDAARDQGLEFDQVASTRDGGTEIPRPRLLERRCQANRQPRLPATSEIHLRRLPPDSQRRLRSSRHHAQRTRRAGTQARRTGEVILDHTPFYAESGGQVGDKGWFYSDDHNTIIAEVTGCYCPCRVSAPIRWS